MKDKPIRPVRATAGNVTRPARAVADAPTKTASCPSPSLREHVVKLSSRMRAESSCASLNSRVTGKGVPEASVGGGSGARLLLLCV